MEDSAKTHDVHRIMEENSSAFDRLHELISEARKRLQQAASEQTGISEQSSSTAE